MPPTPLAKALLVRTSMARASSLLLPVLSVVALLPRLEAQDALRGDVRPTSGVRETVGLIGASARILLTNAPGHPSTGSLGVTLRPGVAFPGALDRPAVSSDGARVAIRLQLDDPSPARDEALWIDGSLATREGGSITGALPGEIFGPLPTEFSVDGQGALLLAHRSLGVPPSSDDLLLRLDPTAGGGFSPVVLAREGQPIGALVPTRAQDLPRGRFHSPTLLDGGGVAFGLEGLIDTSQSSTSQVVVVDRVVLAESLVTTPVGATLPWQNFDLDRFRVTPSGQHALIRGDLTGVIGLDDVVVHDGTVVTQEGTLLASGVFSEAIDLGDSMRGSLDPVGRWTVRGDLFTSKSDFVLRDGVVLAQSQVGNEVVPGSGETWDDTLFPECFFAFSGNSSGAFVIGGVTDSPPDQDGVLLLQGPSGERVVVCREGDPVDLDGNGSFDDDRFLNTFGDDDIVLLDDLSIVFTATLRNGMGVAVDEALIRLEPKAASTRSRNGSGSNPADLNCLEPARLGQSAVFEIVHTTDTIGSVLQWSVFALTPLPTSFGELLVDVTPGLTISVQPSVPGSPGVPARYELPVPNRLSLLGVPFTVQGFRVVSIGGVTDGELLNAWDLQIGR